MKFFFFPILLISPVLAHTQSILKSNDPAIRYDLIKPGHNVESVIQFDSLGNKSQEYLADNYIVRDQNTGQIALVRSSSDETTKAQYIDTSFIVITPVRMHSLEHPAHKELHVQFGPNTVTVNSLINGISKTQVYTMKPGYFDDNILVDIMGYFPMKKGIKYKMEGFRFESVKNKGVSSYEAEYQHDDFLPRTVDHTNIACKVISFTNDYCSGYAWYEKSSGKPQKLLIYLGKYTYLVNCDLLKTD